MNYTLNLFAHLLERPPIGLSPQVAAAGQTAVTHLGTTKATEEAAEEALVVFGLRAWPYWEAEREFMEHVGGKKHAFLQHLPASLHEKWVAFEQAGHSIHDFRDGQTFEDAFTPEGNQHIETAMIDAHTEEAKRLAMGERHDAYMQLVNAHIEERDAMVAALDALAALKDTGEKWDAEIDETIAYMKRGFAKLEEAPTLEKIEKKIEWYQGQIESGEK